MSIMPASGINFGFQASDLLSNSGALVSSVAGFVILALIFLVAPRFVSFLKSAIGKGR